MKKSIISLAFLAFCTIAAGCSAPSSSSPLASSTSSTSSSESQDSSDASDPEPVIVEVDKTYAVTTVAGEGSEIALQTELTDGVAVAGTTISFTVTVTDEAYELAGVTADGKKVEAVDGVYSFTMPNHAVTIETTTNKLGEASVVEVGEVDESMVPTTLEGVRDLLVKEATIEGDYFQSGTYSYETTESNDTLFDYKITAGANDVLRIEGTQRSSVSANLTTGYFEERGIDPSGYYYEYTHTAKPSESLPEGEGSETLKTYKIQDEEPDTDEVTTADAEKKSASYGFGDLLVSKYFDPEASFSFLSTSSWGWTDCKFIPAVVAADEKSFTVGASAIYNGYDYDVISLSMTFDGDGFLTKADYSEVTYESDDFDTETNQPVEGAVATNTTTRSITATRGYKKTIAKDIALSDYAMSDYDVLVDYTRENSYEDLHIDGNRVENGSTLSFRFYSNDGAPALISPRFVGVAEGDEDFVDVSTTGVVTVLKEGTFGLVFDNGAGVTKEVEVTAIPAIVTDIEASLTNDTIFVGGTTTLNVAVVPSAASQEVTVAVDKENSQGDASVVASDDAGIYNVTGLKAGYVIIDVTSIANPDATMSVTLTVNERPDVTILRSNLNTMTFAYEEYDRKLYVNFNENGTGEYLYGETTYDYEIWEYVWDWESAGFTWTLDDESLQFTITCETQNMNKFTAVSVISNTSLSATITFHSTSHNYIIDAQTRVENLETLK